MKEEERFESRHYERALHKQRLGWHREMINEDLQKIFGVWIETINKWVHKGLRCTWTSQGRVFKKSDVLDFFAKEAVKTKSFIRAEHLKKVFPHKFRKRIQFRNRMSRYYNREIERERDTRERKVEVVYEDKRSAPSIIGKLNSYRAYRNQSGGSRDTTNMSGSADQDD